MTITISYTVYLPDRLAPDLADTFLNVDIFRSIGYWAYGHHLAAEQWLIYERVDEPMPSEKQCQEAEDCLLAGQPLPPGWFVWGSAQARSAFEAGCKKYGSAWWTAYDHDAETYDVLVQLVLFGEVKYG